MLAAKEQDSTRLLAQEINRLLDEKERRFKSRQKLSEDKPNS